MKKLSICILAALLVLLLLLFLPANQLTEVSYGVSGNTAGNIGNGGTAAEDEKHIYYAAYDGGLYKEDKVNGSVKKIGGSISDSHIRKFFME